MPAFDANSELLFSSKIKCCEYFVSSSLKLICTVFKNTNLHKRYDARSNQGYRKDNYRFYSIYVELGCITAIGISM